MMTNRDRLQTSFSLVSRDGAYVRIEETPGRREAGGWLNHVRARVYDGNYRRRVGRTTALSYNGGARR